MLVLLAVLPALVLTLVIGLGARRSAAASATDQSLQVARLAAGNQEALLEGARQVLVAGARLPVVQPGDAADCSAALLDLLEQFPFYLNFGVSDLNGDIWCSALELAGPVNNADRGYFIEALAAGSFSIGDYQIGRITGRSSINFGYPVRGADGAFNGVIFAAFDLERVQEMIEAVELPEGATITVRDKGSVILARAPDPALWVGQSLPDAPIFQAIATQQSEGTAETPGVDGVERLYSFAPVQSEQKTAAFVSVGVPSSAAFAEADRITAGNLIALAVVALLALAAAWIGSEVLLLRQIKRLLDATQRVAGGDLTARSGLHGGSGELDRLGQAFDKMAQALETRAAEQQQAQEALFESERKLSLVFSNVSDIIFYLRVEPGGNYRFRSINPAFLTATGLAEEQVVGKLVQEVLPEPAHALVLGKYGEAIRDKRTVKWEEVSEYPSGTKYGEVSVTPVVDATGRCTHLVGAVHDITDRKQAEEKVRLLNQELEQRVEERTAALAAANHELEAFAYSVSHDLRAPLRSIDGFSQALEEDFGPVLGEQGLQYLARVRAAAQRMAELIDDLLTLSRVTRVEMNRVSVRLDELAQEIADEMQADQPERDAEIVIAADVTARGDKGLLRSLLANLFSNAWKFTGRRAHTRIEFGVTDTDGQPTYFVNDNGAGFDMKYDYKLFGAFQRLHREAEFPGTGIGLATVQRIVRRHGGQVWARSEPDKGATFYFTLKN